MKNLIKATMVMAMSAMVFTVSAQERGLRGPRSGADQNRERPTIEQIIQHNVDQLTQDLGLNSKQQKKLTELQTKQMEAMREGPAAGEERPSREEMQAQMQQRQNEYEAEVKKILTKEQFEKYQELQEERRGKMQERFQNAPQPRNENIAPKPDAERPAPRQDSERPAPGEMVKNYVNQMTKDLGLSADQQKQLEELQTAQMREIAGMRQRPEAGAERPSREEMQAQMQQRQDNYEAQLKKILTTEQFEKYQQLQQERRKQMQDRMQNDRNRRAARPAPINDAQ